MAKVILVITLLAFILYFIVRRLRMFGVQLSANSGKIQSSLRIIEITLPYKILKAIVQKTLFSVFTGILLLIVILVLATKFKITLIMLPVSLYLIGQFFILNNHIRHTRNQRIFYDKTNDNLTIESLDGEKVMFNLINDVRSYKEVKSVQKNNGILFGYYEIILAQQQITISYLLKENIENKILFDKLGHFPMEVETRLFPVI
ncbi:hypothetical protein [Sphingobacterium lumbrici]|uniref:hypothetical protein n=1 Tax=Sphingobacterium lumbrici TaxID=2559600 RepID=UPI00112AFA09|nr:hypothetical protein [Sphingobacterium lumbrici]